LTPTGSPGRGTPTPELLPRPHPDRAPPLPGAAVRPAFPRHRPRPSILAVSLTLSALTFVIGLMFFPKHEDRYPSGPVVLTPPFASTGLGVRLPAFPAPATHEQPTAEMPAPMRGLVWSSSGTVARLGVRLTVPGPGTYYVHAELAVTTAHGLVSFFSNDRVPLTSGHELAAFLTFNDVCISNVDCTSNHNGTIYLRKLLVKEVDHHPPRVVVTLGPTIIPSSAPRPTPGASTAPED